MIDTSCIVELSEESGCQFLRVFSDCESVCLAMVERRPYAIQFITSPNETVCFAAIRQDGSSIKHIASPSEAMCLAAVRKDGYAIRFIIHPTEKMFWIAVKCPDLRKHLHSGWVHYNALKELIHD